MLPSLKRTRSAPRNSTRFAAQYPARGLPCERFAAGLATRLAHHSGPRRLARPFLAEDLHLLFFRQLDWRTQLWVMTDKTHSEHNASGVRPLADIDAEIDL